MATLSITEKNLVLALNARERTLFGKPSLSLELSRITAVSIEPMPAKESLGIRVTSRTLFGSLTGQWRLGSSKVLVFRGKSGSPALKISLKHPTVDQIWYSGKDYEQIFHLLLAKTDK